MRPRTKIVATLGPATDARGVVGALARAGLDVARLNAAHGTESEHAARIAAVRAAARTVGRPMAVLLDLPGPKLRIGAVPGGSVELRPGEVVSFGPRAEPGVLTVSVRRLAERVRRGETLQLADGSVRLVAERVGGGRVRARVVVGGLVRSGSGLNLPETDLGIRVPTAADRRWIAFARREGVDWIGVSFVQGADELERARRLAGGGPRLVAKIEKRRALEGLGAIVAAADAVMVARGDLGVETPLAEVPIVQKRIIAAANRAGRPVITATQMLESMVENPSPTRAEIADVANAVLDGTDAVMLSAETAIGRFPERAVRVLDEVLTATETVYPFGNALARFDPKGDGAATIADEACRLAASTGARAIVVPRATVEAALAVARFRPRAPVVALAASEADRRALALAWGVVPLAPGPEARDPVEGARRVLRRAGLARAGERFVAVLRSAAGAGPADTVRLGEA